MLLLDLQDVVFYGFSDDGIVGLLSAVRCPRITTLVISGANLTRGTGTIYKYFTARLEGKIAELMPGRKSAGIQIKAMNRDNE